MKKYILLILAFLSLNLAAKNDTRALSVPAIKINYAKSSNVAYVKFKYTSYNSRTYGMKYEIKLPLSYSGISALGKKPVYTRFESAKVQYSSRFQNLEKLDLSAIVEKNKTYNLAKTNTVTFRSL
jgi:hypothetical protein